MCRTRSAAASSSKFFRPLSKPKTQIHEIRNTTQELDQIDHAFAFISMDFSTPESHLQEIANDTAINGTAITVYELFKLGDEVVQNRISIADILPMFTTNQLFAVN